jgi:hypothetical protein
MTTGTFAALVASAESFSTSPTRVLRVASGYAAIDGGGAYLGLRAYGGCQFDTNEDSAFITSRMWFDRQSASMRFMERFEKALSGLLVLHAGILLHKH